VINKKLITKTESKEQRNSLVGWLRNIGFGWLSGNYEYTPEQIEADAPYERWPYIVLDNYNGKPFINAFSKDRKLHQNDTLSIYQFCKKTKEIYNK